MKAEREAGLKDGSLPQIHISGCTSSCGTHQTGVIGFHGGVKVIDKVSYPGYTLHFNGCDRQGEERMGEELGFILEEEVPQFLVKLGQSVEEEQTTFDQWLLKHPEGVKEVAAAYLR